VLDRLQQLSTASTVASFRNGTVNLLVTRRILRWSQPQKSHQRTCRAKSTKIRNLCNQHHRRQCSDPFESPQFFYAWSIDFRSGHLLNIVIRMGDSRLQVIQMLYMFHQNLLHDCIGQLQLSKPLAMSKSPFTASPTYALSQKKRVDLILGIFGGVLERYLAADQTPYRFFFFGCWTNSAQKPRCIILSQVSRIPEVILSPAPCLTRNQRWSNHFARITPVFHFSLKRIAATGGLIPGQNFKLSRQFIEILRDYLFIVRDAAHLVNPFLTLHHYGDQKRIHVVIYTDICYFFHGLVFRFRFLGWGVSYTPDQPVSYDLVRSPDPKC